MIAILLILNPMKRRCPVMTDSSEIRRELRKPGIPYDCLLAVYLWRHPWQQAILTCNRKVSWFFYHPIDKCFYSKTPDNKVHNDWVRARGMDQNLAQAMKFFPELCLPFSIISDEEVQPDA